MGGGRNLNFRRPSHRLTCTFWKASEKATSSTLQAMLDHCASSERLWHAFHQWGWRNPWQRISPTALAEPMLDACHACMHGWRMALHAWVCFANGAGETHCVHVNKCMCVSSMGLAKPTMHLTQLQCCLANGTDEILLSCWWCWRNRVFRHLNWQKAFKNRPPPKFLRKETRLTNKFLTRTLSRHFAYFLFGCMVVCWFVKKLRKIYSYNFVLGRIWVVKRDW